GINDDRNNINRFMHLMSSNYPDATDMTNTGSGSTDNGYYMVPGGESDLVSIFTQIGDQIGQATIDLDANATVIDYVTPYFKIPEGATVDISVMDADYSSGTLKWKASTMDTSGITYTVNEKDRYVTVTGFDYNNNFVASQGRVEGNIAEEGDFYGRKLIMKFSIATNPEFLGGNNVPTNAEGSGMYVKNDAGQYEIVEEFDVPELDVVTGSDVTITSRLNAYLGAFLLQDVTVDNLKGVIDVGYAGVTLQLDKPNYGLDPEMSKFINVAVNMFVEDPAGSGNYIKVDEINDVTEDVKYKLQVIVTPKDTDGDCKEASDEAEGVIKVFYPEMTFKDSSAYYYGEAVPTYNSKTSPDQVLGGCLVETVWKNSEGLVAGSTLQDGTVVSMSTEVPELEVELTAPTGMTVLPKQDVPMNAQVKMIGYLDESNLNQYVTFHWNACDPSCGQTISSHDGDENVPEFYLHPQTCQLTVKKSGGEADTPHVFTVMKDGKEYTQLRITGNGEVTIYELPIGTYSIKEDDGWSWRSNDPTYDPADFVLSKTQSAGSIECKNTIDEIYWLNGYSDVNVNIFGKAKKN
ncbi:MAG: hypothetical protein IJY74_07295, partial [Oscillospiraceae bacterium]|nr:hypothetical protein [Oscillospiraceae bacterium]